MKPLVQNAADVSQVRDADRKVMSTRDQELKDLREVLALRAGQRFVWRFMERCKAFESIWAPSALIHYNSGQQDIGHFLMAEVVEADPSALITMMKEKQVKEKE